jgi:predicted NAD/FAD-dependent oxidoreductase
MQEFGIIGAGISGILLGSKLPDHIILEKSRGVGGRIAARRLAVHSLNHGPLKFKLKEGKEINDPHTWIKELSLGLNIHKGKEVSHFEQIDDGHLIVCKDGESYKAKHIIITAPAPQAKSLLERSGLNGEFLKPVTYRATIQFLLFSLSTIDTQKLETYFDLKQVKATDENHSLKLFHLKEELIPLYLEKEKEEIKSFCQSLLEGEIIDCHCHKWRYAEVNSPINPHWQLAHLYQGISLAGDYFGTQGIESSMESVFSLLNQPLFKNKLSKL